MKNRLQFNRHFPIFSGATQVVDGEEKWVSGREQAKTWLENQIKRTDFIPLIGEPIVLRYLDKEGKKQLILAVGKATGNTIQQTSQREYHIIDSAELAEGVELANENAAEALDLASAATKTVADYRVILQNMIGDGGIEMEDGSYFDTDDPTRCGLYKVYPGTNFISAATSLAKADYILDTELGKVKGSLEETVGKQGELSAATVALSDKVDEFSANTVNELNAVNDRVSELSAATEAFSAATDELLDNIKEGAGLEPDGTYEHKHDANFIDDATSLFGADVILDEKLAELSGNTVAGLNEVASNAETALNELSGNTVAALNELSGNSDSKIRELSAGTVAADQVLQGQIDELANRKILGQNAVKTNPESGDTTVSLLLSEQDKVLSQDVYGLKANLTLSYSSADTKIYLLGKDDENNRPMVLGEVETTDFIKDGMISAVTVFTPTQEWIDIHSEYSYAQLSAGTPYLWITFNMDSPTSPKDVFLRLDSLVDTYTVDPDSTHFMEINDYVISLHVNEDGGLAGYDYAKGISAVTTNIISATGLNIGAQGTYPGHDDTNYIKYAGSLDQADVLLDAAIGNLSGVVADMGDMSEIEAKLNNLSSATESFSSATHNAIMELSARTFDPSEIYEYIDRKDAEEASARTEADEDLQEQIDEIVEHMTGEFIPLDNYEIATGSTMEELEVNSGDTVNEAFGKIQKQILDNEEAVAASLNDLNDRIEELSGATEQSVSDLWDAINATSAATNGVLTLSVNGTEQGKYCPSADTAINLEVIQEVTGADVLLTGYEIASGRGEDLQVLDTDNVNEAFGKIQKQIIDNELVISSAFNDVNNRLNEVSGNVADMEEKIDEIEGNMITGVSIDGVLQPVVGNVVNLEIDVPVVANFFDYAAYDSNDKNIYFKHGGSGGTIVSTIDATDFIKDGMVDNVVIGVPTAGTHSGETCLIITFNTDAGKEAIEIPVADIFDPATLNELSASVISNQNKIAAVSGDVIALSAAVVGDVANLDALSASVVNNRNDIDLLSGTILDNELVVASALNDLNDRIEELSGATGGDASKLDHNVTLNIAGESYGSASTNFQGNTVDINTYKKFETAATMTNLTLSEFLTVVSVAADTTVTFAASGLPVLPAGGLKEAHIIVENTGSSNVAITVASDARVKCTGGNVFTIPGNDIGELNALITYDGSAYTIYVITT